MKEFIDQLRWRGMLHDVIPGSEEYLSKNKTIGYIGFDPTSDSLHIGSLVPIFILKHFQNAGHTPVVLLGGATGMIGDPSGKSDERNLLDKNILKFNEKKLKVQFEKFLDFKSNKSNKAILVNNYDWMSKFSIIDFSRDIGKHITVNYMMAKESVKKRISKDTTQGMSFTEFTYQLIQGYDFLHLYKEINCMLQMGASDIIIDRDFERELLLNGVLSRKDYLGKADYIMANNKVVNADLVKIEKIEIGDYIINDVVIGIIDEGALLCGISFLDLFKKWEIDKDSSSLILYK